MKCLTKCIYRGSKVGEDCEILIDPRSCQLFDDGAERNPLQQQVRKPNKFTIEQENAIFFVVQWLFKNENKDRIIHRNEIFKMIYDELNG